MEFSRDLVKGNIHDRLHERCQKVACEEHHNDLPFGPLGVPSRRFRSDLIRWSVQLKQPLSWQNTARIHAHAHALRKLFSTIVRFGREGIYLSSATQTSSLCCSKDIRFRGRCTAMNGSACFFYESIVKKESSKGVYAVQQCFQIYT